MIRVVLLSRPWRLVAAALTALSLVTLPTYLLAVFVLPPIPPIVMVRSFVLGTALPGVMAWALLRAFTGSAEVRDGVLRLQRGDLAVEVPCTAIAAVRPWWVPLPSPGFRFALRGGGSAPLGVALTDPTLLLERMAADGLDVAPARRHPSVVHAGTRAPADWRWAVLKFALFGTIPAGILFYTHQHIAYGGTLGQYYLEGPGAYLDTWAEYWTTTVILLLSYASCWRALAEASVWLGALAGPAPARGVRRTADATCALAYYMGVPLLLALRYLA